MEITMNEWEVIEQNIEPSSNGKGIHGLLMEP
jgi:hypothetical protein